MNFRDGVVLVTGGTGSIGKQVVRRLLASKGTLPAKIIVFSRDEAKQHQMQLELPAKDYKTKIEYRIGDIRDYNSVVEAVKYATAIFNTAALKHVPSCEYYPMEAIRTNTLGADNIVRALRNKVVHTAKVVVAMSTDKACLPVNVMGMTKALQEKIFILANLDSMFTKFVCVRYGNILTSRGSVLQYFMNQIRAGGPVEVTNKNMTRFLITVDDAVDTAFAAASHARPGEIYVPLAHSARLIDIVNSLADRELEIVETGLRPGEKMHEHMVSDEEAPFTELCDKWVAIRPMIPELAHRPAQPFFGSSYCSNDSIATPEATKKLIQKIIPDRDCAQVAESIL